MDGMLNRRGRDLEEAFFRKQDAALIAQHERLEHKRRTREALAEYPALRIRVLDKLTTDQHFHHGVSRGGAIVEVAGRRTGTEKERETILASASKCGICKKSVITNCSKPGLIAALEKLLAAWTTISGLCETMTPRARSVEIRADISRTGCCGSCGRLSGADVESIPAGTGDSRRNDRRF